MSVLTEIRTLLSALGSLGTITIGKMGDSPNVIGTLYEYGGQPPERRFGVLGIGYEKPACQLVFRGDPDDYAGPRAKAEIAWRYLPTITPGALGAGVTTIYLSIDPQQSPGPVGPVDVLNRIKIGFNFYVMKEPS